MSYSSGLARSATSSSDRMELKMVSSSSRWVLRCEANCVSSGVFSRSVTMAARTSREALSTSATSNSARIDSVPPAAAILREPLTSVKYCIGEPPE